MFEATVADGVLCARRVGARWLATGHDGGVRTADAAYNISVPEGFDRDDLDTYVGERRERAGFEAPGPALLTGVPLAQARGARDGPVTAVATVGLSNPATLPVDATGDQDGDGAEADVATDQTGHDDAPPGTVNLLVGTTRALTDGGLASLLATAVEAKTATLRALTGFTGTTSDGVVVGCLAGGDPSAFAGSATEVGAATRACVRAAVSAGVRARYPDDAYPDGVAEAEYGTRTDRTAAVFHVE
jgi:adenosylcobinamide hydrolase